MLRATLTIQRGVRCWLSRLELLRLKYERSAIIIQENSFQWRKKLMKRKLRRDQATALLHKLHKHFARKLLLRGWNANVRERAALRIQGLLKIREAKRHKTQLQQHRAVTRILAALSVRRECVAYNEFRGKLKKIQALCRSSYKRKDEAARSINSAYKRYLRRKWIHKIRGFSTLNTKA